MRENYELQTPRENLVRDMRMKFELKRAYFPLFSRLPPELRQQIWSIAASSPPSHPTRRVYILPKKAVESCHIVHEPRNRALLATNTEARQVALMSPRPTRDFNPKLDILYVPRQSLNAFRVALFRPKNPEWTLIRHLALPSTELYRVLANPDFFLRLQCVHTLSTVYPASSGTVGYSQDVSLPAAAAEEDGAVYLRQLTDGELTGITVKADYPYVTWWGTFPIRWTRTGAEYLRWAQATLERVQERLGIFPIMVADGVEASSCYKGRCFQVLPAPQRFGP